MMAAPDLSSDLRYAIGLNYNMQVKLTRLVVKDQAGKSIPEEQIFNDYIKVSYKDAGAFSVDLYDKRLDRTIEYPVRSDFGNKLGERKDDLTDEVSIETGTRTVTARGRSKDIDLTISNNSNIDSRITGVLQLGNVSQ